MYESMLPHYQYFLYVFYVSQVIVVEAKLILISILILEHLKISYTC